MRREQKAAIVMRLREDIGEAAAAIVVEYKGITMESLHRLRVQLREKGARFRVVKNTLFIRACEGSSNERLRELAGGPVAVAYTDDDPAVLAKELTVFAKKEEKIRLRGGVLSGKLLDLQGVQELATLPPLDELRARFLALLQTPAQSFLGVLLASPRGLFGVLNARIEQLESANE